MTALPGLEHAVSKRALSQFFTPPATAERIVKLALGPLYGVYGLSILEPSCGQGALIRALSEWGLVGAITAIDLDPENIAYLSSKPFLKPPRLICADFLTWQPTAAFDLAVLNPPFENGQTEAHIMKALECCARVVCHCPLTTLEGKDRGENLWSKVDLTQLAICSSRPKYASGGGKTAMCTVDVRKRLCAMSSPATKVSWWP